MLHTAGLKYEAASIASGDENEKSVCAEPEQPTGTSEVEPTILPTLHIARWCVRPKMSNRNGF